MQLNLITSNTNIHSAITKKKKKILKIFSKLKTPP